MRRAAAALLAAGMVLAACSGDDDQATGDESDEAGEFAGGARAGAAAAGGADDDQGGEGGSGDAGDASVSEGDSGEDGDAGGQSGEGGATGAGNGGTVCPGATTGAAPAATTEAIPDVDGDGQGDEAWVAASAGGDDFGIVTSGGVTASGRVSLPGATLSLLVADADQRSPVEVFVGDGGTVELWAFDGCELRPVAGPDGPVTFDLGREGTDTGIGCVDVGEGHRDLVGLGVSEDDGTTVVWVRTVIELDGFAATTGRSDSGTFTRPDDAESIDLLHTVSCHDITLVEGAVAA